jgi:raffinose/stachyose/melibiose transport system substrate-binding protein
MARKKRFAALVAVTAGATLVLTACGSNSSGSNSSGSNSSGGSDGGSTSSGTLTLWHYEGPNSAMGIAWNAAIKKFEATHPGVTVKFEEKGFEQIRQTAQLVLNSDQAPDVMEFPKGNATAGLISSQGLLTDLTSEVKKRGWDTKLSASLQTTARYDDKGVMGSGNWYGIPNYGEYVMVYYNKKLFADHGVTVPTTLADFESAMAKFKGAGITPLAVGGAEYPAQQIMYELALSKADRSWIDNYELYKGNVDFHDQAFSYGANTLSAWVKNGYISKDSSGIKAEDMGVAFEQGKYPIMVSGSWWYGRFKDEIKKFDWGTFLFPGNKFAPGSSGNIWVVPKGSKHKSLANDFIDITMSPDIQNLLGNSGGIPVAADTTKITDHKNKELLNNWNTLLSNDGLAFYPDWPAPGYYDVLVAGAQGLITGTKSPDAMLNSIAKPYQDNLKTLK